MEKPLIYVVVLTWNNYQDTKECLNSLLTISEPEFKILVVDNASTDNSIIQLQHDFPNFEYLLLKENCGISGGYNAGISYSSKAEADYILLTNNDIVFSPQTLKELVAAAQTIPDLGIAVPKTINYYDHNILAGIGGKWRYFPPSVKMIGMNKQDSEKYSRLQVLEFAISACYLVTIKLVNSIGKYDTDYFFYNDDWDYSIRAREAGFTIMLIPSAQVWHKVSISTQKSEKKDIWWEYFGHSTFIFYKKHRNNFELSLYAIWFIFREALKLNFNRIAPFLKGLWREANR